MPTTMSEIKKKYCISFITNEVVVKADSQEEAEDLAIELQIYNGLPTEIIKVKRTTYLSTSGAFSHC